MNVITILCVCASATLALGCRRVDPSAERATSGADPAPSASFTEQAGTCARKVRRLTFTSCNPSPSQTAYPECTNYEIGPAVDHADHGCIPGLLRLTVSGYPGRMDVSLVEAKAGATGRIELVVDSHLQATSGAAWPKGTRLGELSVSGDRVESLVLSGAIEAPFGVERVPCPGADGEVADCTLGHGDAP